MLHLGLAKTAKKGRRNECLNQFPLPLSSDGCVLAGDDFLLVRWLSSTSKPGIFLPLLLIAQTHSFLVLAHCPLCCHLYFFQPVHLSTELEGLLLSMCEDIPVRRTDLLTVLDACELHHKASMLPPAERLIRQLVEDVYRNSVSAGLVQCQLVRWCHVLVLSGLVPLVFEFTQSTDFLLASLSWTVMSLQVDHVSMAENGSQLTDRSQMVRDRLHSKKLSPFVSFPQIFSLNRMFFCLLPHSHLLCDPFALFSFKKTKKQKGEINLFFHLDFKAVAWYFWKTVYLLSCWDLDEKTDTTLMPVH